VTAPTPRAAAPAPGQAKRISTDPPLTKPQVRHSFLAQRASHLDCRILPGAPQGHTGNASSSSEIPARPLCQRPTEGEQARDFATSPSRPPGVVPRHPALAVHAYGLSVMLVRVLLAEPLPHEQAAHYEREPEARPGNEHACEDQENEKASDDEDPPGEGKSLAPMCRGGYGREEIGCLPRSPGKRC
jgi:hypothetical protein